MGDDNAGAAAPADIVIHYFFRADIQGAGGFVQDEDGGVARQGPGYLQPLFLAAAEIAAPSLTWCS